MLKCFRMLLGIQAATPLFSPELAPAPALVTNITLCPEYHPQLGSVASQQWRVWPGTDTCPTLEHCPDLVTSTLALDTCHQRRSCWCPVLVSTLAPATLAQRATSRQRHHTFRIKQWTIKTKSYLTWWCLKRKDYWSLTLTSKIMISISDIIISNQCESTIINPWVQFWTNPVFCQTKI